MPTAKDPYGNYSPAKGVTKKVTPHIYDLPVGVEGIVVDPVLFKGLQAYQLDAELVPGLGAVLTWNWPDLSEYRQPLATITALKIQRSSLSHKTPICQAGDGNYFPPGTPPIWWPAGTPYMVGTFKIAANGATIATDTNWQTVFSSNAQFVDSGVLATFLGQLPVNYVDPTILTDPGNVFVYRLILLFNRSGVYYELDFNTVTLIKPYTLTISQDNQASKNTISWLSSRPSAAELFTIPGFGTLRITKYPTVDYWSELTWVSPENSPSPASYKLYKMSNGSTFDLVSTNATSPFRDGARPGVGVVYRYKVEAILTDTSHEMSNIVSIDHDGVVGT